MPLIGSLSGINLADNRTYWSNRSDEYVSSIATFVNRRIHEAVTEWDLYLL